MLIPQQYYRLPLISLSFSFSDFVTTLTTAIITMATIGNTTIPTIIIVDEAGVIPISTVAIRNTSITVTNANVESVLFTITNGVIIILTITVALVII